MGREMTILSHACSMARREWGRLGANPVSDAGRGDLWSRVEARECQTRTFTAHPFMTPAGKR